MDLDVVDKKMRTCKIIDFAVPRDSRIEEKEKENRKVSRSKKGVTEDLECESEDYANSCGSLGAITNQFGNRLKEISVAAEVEQVQKTVLLGMARILRKVLEF